MEYQVFKKGYNKIIKQINFEIINVLEEIKKRNKDSDESIYSYHEEYRKFKLNYLNNEPKNPKRLLEEFQNIHYILLNSDTFLFFEKNGHTKRHFILCDNPDIWLKISNCYNDNLRFSFHSNGKYFRQTYISDFIVNPKEVKIANSCNCDTAIELIEDMDLNTKYPVGLNLSFAAIQKYIFEESFNLYFNLINKDFFQNIKFIYDIANSFNFEPIDKVLKDNVFDFSINLSNKKDQILIQKELNNIKDIIELSIDFIINKEEVSKFNGKEEISKAINLKKITKINDKKTLKIKNI